MILSLAVEFFASQRAALMFGMDWQGTQDKEVQALSLALCVFWARAVPQFNAAAMKAAIRKNRIIDAPVGGAGRSESAQMKAYRVLWANAGASIDQIFAKLKRGLTLSEAHAVDRAWHSLKQTQSNTNQNVRPGI